MSGPVEITVEPRPLSEIERAETHEMFRAGALTALLLAIAGMPLPESGEEVEAWLEICRETAPQYMPSVGRMLEQAA